MIERQTGLFEGTKETEQEIKNLSQLKRAIKEGREFMFVDHWRVDYIGQYRIPTKVQTNAFYCVVPGEPDNPVSKANRGLGYYFPYGKASEWKFENGVCAWSGGVNNDRFLSVRFI